MEVHIYACNEALSDNFQTENVTTRIPTSFDSGRLTLDTDSPYFPSRSDQKIMRTETMKAVVLVQELLEELNIELNKEETGLFVATGAFVEDLDSHIGHLLRVFETIRATEDEAEKLKSIFRASPPLLALKTLTNSTMSFVAQYAGIKGNNATFGNTSLSGFHALQEAFYEVKFKSNNALAVASNVGGEYSFVANCTLYENQNGWKESAAVGSILLSSNDDALAKITHLNYDRRIASLEDQALERNWKTLLPDENADVIIHSGAYTQEVFKADQEYLEQFHSNVISDFDQIGNIGPVNLVHGIHRGIQFLNDGAQKIDLLDRDIYGRESHIRIEVS